MFKEGGLWRGEGRKEKMRFKEDTYVHFSSILDCSVFIVKSILSQHAAPTTQNLCMCVTVSFLSLYRQDGALEAVPLHVKKKKRKPFTDSQYFFHSAACPFGNCHLRPS